MLRMCVVGSTFGVLGAAARSVARPSCSGTGLTLGPWDILSDGGSAARLAMLRAPLNLEVALLMCSRCMCCETGVYFIRVYFIVVRATVADLSERRTTCH